MDSLENNQKPVTASNEEQAREYDPIIVEILAFALCEVKMGAVCKLEHSDVDPTEKAREEWQESVVVRKDYREEARNMLAILEDSGARVRSSDGKKLEARLRWVRTVPPRAAYSDDELQA